MDDSTLEPLPRCFLKAEAGILVLQPPSDWRQAFYAISPRRTERTHTNTHTQGEGERERERERERE
jgi:hypothetical protein